MTITHSKAFTAQEIAASLHCPGKEMAKSVIIKIDGKYAMAVLPAPEKINFDFLKSTLKAKSAELADEEEFRSLFPECEVGAMPIFGNLYNMPVYCSKRILDDDDIYFNAGSHTEAIKLPTKDFTSLVHPKVASFSGEMAH